MLLHVFFHHRNIDGFGRRNHLAILEHFVSIPAACQIIGNDDAIVGFGVEGSGCVLFIQDFRLDYAGTRRTRTVNDIAQTCGVQKARALGAFLRNAMLKGSQ